MAASKINSIAYFGDKDINDTVLLNMKIAYYTELPKTYQSEHYQGFLCNMASQNFINIVMQRIKNAGTTSEARQTDHMALKIDLEDFKIVVINGKQHLIKTISGTDKIIVPWEDSFDIVWEGHKEHCHPDAPSLMEILQKKYLVNRNAIECLSMICPVCIGENRPSVKYNIDFVPITNDPDCTFNNVLAYEDTYTKYLHLKPIHKGLTIQELSLDLINVFMDFGPPKKVLISHPVLVRTFNEFKELFRNVLEFEIIVKRVEIDSYKINLIRSGINNWIKKNKKSDWGYNIHNIEWILNNENSKKDKQSANVRDFTANDKAAADLQTPVNENLPSPNLCSRNDPVLSTVIYDPGENILPSSIEQDILPSSVEQDILPSSVEQDILPSSIEQDMIGFSQGPMLVDGEPLEFDENMFENVLKENIYFDYNQSNNNELGEGTSYQMDPPNLQPQEATYSEEVFTEDTPIVTNAEPSSQGLEAYMVDTTVEIDSLPLPELFPEASEHF